MFYLTWPFCSLADALKNNEPTHKNAIVELLTHPRNSLSWHVMAVPFACIFKTDNP